jgi:hypothetical protein
VEILAYHKLTVWTPVMTMACTSMATRSYKDKGSIDDPSLQVWIGCHYDNDSNRVLLHGEIEVYLTLVFLVVV